MTDLIPEIIQKVKKRNYPVPTAICSYKELGYYLGGNHYRKAVAVGNATKSSTSKEDFSLPL